MEELKKQFMEKFFSEEDAPIDPEEIWNWIVSNRLEKLVRPMPAETDGCTCQECERKYKIDILVSNKLWERIKPQNKPEGSGLLCGICIIKKLEQLNEFSHYNLC